MCGVWLVYGAVRSDLPCVLVAEDGEQGRASGWVDSYDNSAVGGGADGVDDVVQGLLLDGVGQVVAAVGVVEEEDVDAACPGLSGGVDDGGVGEKWCADLVA